MPQERLDARQAYERALPRVREEFTGSARHISPTVVVGEPPVVSVQWEILGGARPMGERSLPSVDDVESAVAELTDVLQEQELEAGNTSWPGCQAGHPHPPAATVVGGTAVWVCPRTGVTLRPIGRVAS